jgi:hypothetical protein
VSGGALRVTSATATRGRGFAIVGFFRSKERQKVYARGQANLGAVTAALDRADTRPPKVSDRLAIRFWTGGAARSPQHDRSAERSSDFKAPLGA